MTGKLNLLSGRESFYDRDLLLLRTRVLYRKSTSGSLKAINLSRKSDLRYRISVRVIFVYPSARRGAMLLAKESRKMISSLPEVHFGFSIVTRERGPERNISSKKENT